MWAIWLVAALPCHDDACVDESVSLLQLARIRAQGPEDDLKTFLQETGKGKGMEKVHHAIDGLQHKRGNLDEQKAALAPLKDLIAALSFTDEAVKAKQAAFGEAVASLAAASADDRVALGNRLADAIRAVKHKLLPHTAAETGLLQTDPLDPLKDALRRKALHHAVTSLRKGRGDAQEFKQQLVYIRTAINAAAAMANLPEGQKVACLAAGSALVGVEAQVGTNSEAAGRKAATILRELRHKIIPHKTVGKKKVTHRISAPPHSLLSQPDASADPFAALKDILKTKHFHHEVSCIQHPDHQCNLQTMKDEMTGLQTAYDAVLGSLPATLGATTKEELKADLEGARALIDTDRHQAGLKIGTVLRKLRKELVPHGADRVALLEEEYF